MNAPAIQPSLDLGDARAGHAQLTNMSLALRTLLDCREAGNNAPRMGVFYGFSGYGKTVAAAFAAARTGAIYIHAQSIWTQRTFLETLAEEMGISRPEKTGPRILRQIIDQLNQSPCDIIIDEMDYLVQKRMVEIIRDIHDNTQVGVLMIGEEALPSKLKEWERFDNRILVATAAQPARRTMPSNCAITTAAGSTSPMTWSTSSASAAGASPAASWSTSSQHSASRRKKAATGSTAHGGATARSSPAMSRCAAGRVRDAPPLWPRYYGRPLSDRA